MAAWQGLSDGYIRRVLAVAKAALNRAQRENEITSAPTISLALAPEGEPRERILAIEEMARLFNSATEPHQIGYLIMAVGTIARPEAILEATTYLVNFDARLIRLAHARTRNAARRCPSAIRSYRSFDTCRPALSCSMGVVRSLASSPPSIT
jgi:hypothetical protein